MTSNYTDDGLNLMAGCIYTAANDVANMAKHSITVNQSENVIASGSALAMSHYTWAMLDAEFEKKYG
jgi:hypothetical protein